jgi:hypothetical protein
VISLLGIAFVQFTIKNLCLLISTKALPLSLAIGMTELASMS